MASARNVAVVASATKAIRLVRAGDPVFARDERTGRTVIAKVRKVFVRTSDHLITVGFAASKGGPVIETLKTTRQHPFYVDGKGWLPAGGLAVGNAIVTRAGPRLFVKSVTWHRRPEGYTVYNFEVEPLGARGSDGGKGADGKFTHSYFVGSAYGGAWVHNGKYNLNAALGRIFSKYPATSGDCAVAVEEALEAFRKGGADGAEIVTFVDRERASIMMDASGNNIGSKVGVGRAWHKAIEHDGRIFDALTGAKGATWSEYQKLWHPTNTAPFLEKLVQ